MECNVRFQGALKTMDRWSLRIPRVHNVNININLEMNSLIPIEHRPIHPLKF